MVKPTAFLPPVARLDVSPTLIISNALDRLRRIYISAPPAQISTKLRSRRRKKAIISDVVPDSGYASAEDESFNGKGDVANDSEDQDSQDEDDLRVNTLERTYAMRWLTGLIARSSSWVCVDDEAEAAEREALVEDAANLLAACAGKDDSEPGSELTRRFKFTRRDGGEAISVELNDAPLSAYDHTSVGLQSWASSIMLARMLCEEPTLFGLHAERWQGARRLRVLELGAGTGLLSITVAKMALGAGRDLEKRTSSTVDADIEIVATDYHPDVLVNLHRNVHTNFPYTDASTAPVDVRAFDWQYPLVTAPFDAPFDIILAADVIYHAEHAGWIRACAERLLARPTLATSAESNPDAGGVFWLIIPVRRTGRHEGVGDTVQTVFPPLGGGEEGLRVLDVREVARSDGVGRADEGGYRLFKIGWAR